MKSCSIHLAAATLAAASLSASAGCGKSGNPEASAAATPGSAHAASAATQGDKGAAGAADQVPGAPSRGPEHAVYSLIDNRLSAHVERDGGLLVLAGSAGFGKYMRFGRQNQPWVIRQHDGDVHFATMKSKVAGVVVPLTAAEAQGAPAVRVRVRSHGAGRLGLRVNGKRDKEVTVQLQGGWSTAELSPPAGALAAGENELLFFAKSPLDVAWIEVGGGADKSAGGDGAAPAPAAAAGAPAGGSPDLTIYDPRSKSLVLPKGGGMAWYVVVPDKGRLTGDLQTAGCKVVVHAAPDSGTPVEGTLSGRGSAVDLAGLAGKVVRLDLTAEGCPAAHLAGAALVVPGPAPTYSLDGKKRPTHIVFWIMDALRADRVRAIFPDARPETPNFDKLARSSAVFTQAYQEGNESKCSHASMWTSLYPVNHKMIPPNSTLDLKWVTLDEVAKAGGLSAVGVSANGYITPKRGFGNHWDAFKNHIHTGGGLTAGDVLKDGFAQLAAPTDPWFLYLGTIDTHVSWRAKEPWLSKYDPEPYSGRFKTQASGQDMGLVASGKLKVTDRDKKRIIALYDSNVSYQDSEIPVLLDKLVEWGVADDTMLIITGDHGDEQFEDGRVGHGGSSRETLVHVPLFVHYPPMVPAGKVSEGAEAVDILPTIADALGVKPDPAWQGESLLPLVNGVGRGYPRMTMSSNYENGHAARINQWKIYVSGGSRGALYDLKTEPGEKTDVADEHPVELRLVSDALWMLRTYNVDWKKSRWGNPANVTAAFAADMGE